MQSVRGYPKWYVIVYCFYKKKPLFMRSYLVNMHFFTTLQAYSNQHTHWLFILRMYVWIESTLDFRGTHTFIRKAHFKINYIQRKMLTPDKVIKKNNTKTSSFL